MRKTKDDAAPCLSLPRAALRIRPALKSRTMRNAVATAARRHVLH